METTQDRWSTRAVSRSPLLLLVALVAVVAGAVPGSRVGAAPTKATPPGDPPGNNGTIKIERDGPLSAGQNNEPQVDGCIFWLEYYGFDQGQTADITFTAQAPSTPKDTVLVADKGVIVSDTPAGGGQDKDYVIAYNLTSAVQGLTAHPRRGYHVKVSSDTVGAPGGAKQKVFWIKCTPAPTTTLRVIKAIEGSGTGPFTFEVQCNHRPLDMTFTLNGGDFRDVTDVPSGTTCAVIETGSNNAQIRIEERPATGPPVDGVVTLTAGIPTNVFVTNVFPGSGGTPAPADAELRAAGGVPDTVLAETATRPEPAATLPRTGADPRPLAATGLWSLAAGALALVAARRRRP
ncbi:MAG: DUF5979 domain-containing protein [Actinomycetota bacterium]|jgi:LPXTG-motif cell wall-anchored protein